MRSSLPLNTSSTAINSQEGTPNRDSGLPLTLVTGEHLAYTGVSLASPSMSSAATPSPSARRTRCRPCAKAGPTSPVSTMYIWSHRDTALLDARCPRLRPIRQRRPPFQNTVRLPLDARRAIAPAVSRLHMNLCCGVSGVVDYACSAAVVAATICVLTDRPILKQEESS